MGTNKVQQMMLDQKIKISEKTFKPVITSPILRHKKTRDIVRSHGVIKKTCVKTPLN